MKSKKQYVKNFAKKLAKAAGAVVADNVANNLVSTLKRKADSSFNKAKYQRTGGYTPRARQVTTGRFAGKVRKFKKPNRKLKVKGKMTRYGIITRGTGVVDEIRYTSKTNNDLVNRAEGVIVAHTSMPVKVCIQNLCRAMIKYLFAKLQIQMVDFTRPADSYGMAVADQINLNYYIGYTSTSVSQIPYNYTAGQTFEFIAYQFANALNGINDVGRLRFDSINFIPSISSKLSKVDLNLTSVTVHCITDSHLKVQNRTTSLAVDNEADDVNNVPLQGKLMVLKGNNVMRKLNTRLLPGVADPVDETMLYGAWSHNTKGTVGGRNTGYQLGGGDSTFFKPNQVPKEWELNHVVKSSKVYIQPGGIKTSTIRTKYSMSFHAYVQLLCQGRGNNTNDMVFDPRLGYTHAFFLEKAIGSNISDVAIIAETEFKHYVCLDGKTTYFTQPLQTQVDIVAP